MKWEIIADKLSKAGLSWGYSSVRSNYAARRPRIQARRRREAPDDAGPPDAQTQRAGIAPCAFISVPACFVGGVPLTRAMIPWATPEAST